jgi:hypothetical protein
LAKADYREGLPAAEEQEREREEEGSCWGSVEEESCGEGKKERGRKDGRVEQLVRVCRLGRRTSWEVVVSECGFGGRGGKKET